jgi:hypothetical protein
MDEYYDHLLLLGSQFECLSTTVGNELCSEVDHTTAEVDQLLIKASQQYESNSSATAVEIPVTHVSSQFTRPVSSESIDQLIESQVLAKTRSCTRWALNVWREWAVFRRSLHPREAEGAAHELKDDFFS